MGRGVRISPLPEAQLQDVEDEKPAAGWAAVCLEPEGAEELRHAAGCQAGDGEPKAAQLPLQQVVDDGAEPWEKKERVLGDATLKMPPAASPRIRSPCLYLGLPAPAPLVTAAQPAPPRGLAEGGLR